MAVVRPGLLRQRFGEGVHRQLDRRVPDRVERELPAHCVRLADDLAELLLRTHEAAAVGLLAPVGLLGVGRRAGEAPVHEDLERTHPQAFVALAAQPPEGLHGLGPRPANLHCGSREFVSELGIDGLPRAEPGRRHARVHDARDSEAQQVAERRDEALPEFLRRRVGDEPGDEVLPFPDHPVQLAVGSRAR